MHSFDDFRVGPWALRDPWALRGAQHTKVEVRVAPLLGRYSFDDFTVGPWALVMVR